MISEGTGLKRSDENQTACSVFSTSRIHFKSQMMDSRPKTDDEHTAQIRTTSQGSLWYLEFGWGKENALISHHFILDTQFDENQ